MTTVVCWLNKERGVNQIWAVSDTRISKQNSYLSGNNYSILLDSGAKLFPLYIKCRNISDFDDRIYFDHSLGMAYSGSSLIGLNLYATLVYLLQNCASFNEGEVPSILDIANFVASLLKRMTTEVGIINPTGAICELAIFGFCHVSSEFKIIHLYPDTKNSTLDIVVKEENTSDDSNLLLLGDKREQIRQLIEKKRAEYVEKDFLWWHSPIEVIRNIVEEAKFDTIGGSIQRCIAAESEFKIYADAFSRKEGVQEETMLYQNIGNKEMVNIGNCFIAVPIFPIF
ncbi:hypothetical protein A0J48_017795 [Sphaerospermopsis aphanizomenoides BCCUSP55]|uniref:hypothetical protein n=1 Tax=Sphaerospermopsis aphanizomenoides TaxID=459663 RepID=UPI0019070A3B|nr:hypothetical protein [Sphaerospermopsis aphanizomenoides]MBK1989364.1 hypothetical protein [Sphaerospermopsis aphanizomenoides BCCUSP55]